MGEVVMHRLFPIVCNMSLTASVVILAVLAVRLLLRRAPKVFAYALWAVVLFRLLCPVSVTSAVSLMGALGAPAQERTQRTSAVEYVPADIMIRGTAPAVTQLPQTPLPAETGGAVNAAPADTAPEAVPATSFNYSDADMAGRDGPAAGVQPCVIAAAAPPVGGDGETAG